MPDVEWIMENCHMMRDNGVWGGEKQDSIRVTFENGDEYYTHSSNVTLYNK